MLKTSRNRPLAQVCGELPYKWDDLRSASMLSPPSALWRPKPMKNVPGSGAAKENSAHGGPELAHQTWPSLRHKVIRAIVRQLEQKAGPDGFSRSQRNSGKTPAEIKTSGRILSLKASFARVGAPAVG